MTKPAEKSGQKNYAGLTIGLTIAFSLVLARSIEEALTPRLGGWPAFGVAVLVGVPIAVLIAIAVALVVSRFFGRNQN